MDKLVFESEISLGREYRFGIFLSLDSDLHFQFNILPDPLQEKPTVGCNVLFSHNSFPYIILWKQLLTCNTLTSEPLMNPLNLDRVLIPGMESVFSQNGFQLIWGDVKLESLMVSIFKHVYLESEICSWNWFFGSNSFWTHKYIPVIMYYKMYLYSLCT